MPYVNASEERLYAVACSLLLALGLMAIYWPALGGSYLWDDDTHFTANTVLEAGGLLRTWLGQGQPNYWPLTWSSFWLEHRMFGFNPVASHLINLLLHAANCGLLLLLLRRLGCPIPMVAVLIFALHPTNVETVAWVTQRKNLLSLLFALLSCLGFVSHWRSGDRRGGWLGIAGFLASLLSKGAAIGLPVVFLLLLYWKRSPIGRRALRLVAPYFALALGFAMVELVFMRGVRAGEAVFELGVSDRIELMARSFSFYLEKSLFPFESIFVYPRWALGQVDLALIWPALAFAALLFAAIALDRRAVVLLLGSFVVLLAPILGATDAYFFKYSYVADHYLYLATAVFASAAAVLSAKLPRLPTYAVVIVISGVMAGVSFQQSAVFRDDETLWRTTLSANRNAWIAHSILGVIEQQRGNLVLAKDHFESTLALQPPSYDAALVHLNLGNLELLQGRPGQARESYARTIAVLPQTTRAWTNLAATHVAEGDFAAHDAVLLEALEHPVDRVRIHGLLARSFAERGRDDRAAEHAERAASLRSERATRR